MIEWNIGYTKSDVGGLDMKKLDIKSLAIGFIIGTVGITTAFAANGIKMCIRDSHGIYRQAAVGPSPLG